MISDGYYAAAAQGRSGPTPAPPGPSIPPLSSAPQSYAGPQPYVSRRAGRRRAASRLPARRAYGQAVFGQPGLGDRRRSYRAGALVPGPGTRPYPGQAPAYPGQAPSYPGQQPGGPDALPGYVPGRRKPMSAEVPPKVHTAIRLMYAGFVATALDVVLSLLVLGRYTHAATVAKNPRPLDRGQAHRPPCRRPSAQPEHDGRRDGDRGRRRPPRPRLLGLARDGHPARPRLDADRRHGAPRHLHDLMLLVLFGTHHDPGAQFTTLVVWALGVAAVIPLWSQQARDFFHAWRKR